MIKKFIYIRDYTQYILLVKEKYSITYYFFKNEYHIVEFTHVMISVEYIQYLKKTYVDKMN